MVDLGIFKELAIATGLYRPARLVFRYGLKRPQLKAFRDEVQFFQSLLAGPEPCFDIGANIGEKSEALLAAGASVVSFEPQADCFRELKARCGHYRGFQASQSAMGSQVGEAQFTIHESRGLSTLANHLEKVDGVEKTVMVPVSTLDEAIKKYGRPTYCKIDVERWELEVLKGLSEPIPIISFEYHTLEGGVESTFACLDQLATLSRLMINITPMEELSLCLDPWISLEEFRLRFPAEFNDKSKFQYGDIFVKMIDAKPRP